MHGAKQWHMQAFNLAVAEWNRSCRRYRYSRCGRDAARGQIDARRAELETEGKAQYAVREAGG